MDDCADSGNNHRFLDAYSYYYLLRYHMGGNNNCRATWVSDTIPRIMEAGKSYSVNVKVRNDGWDTWTESATYRLGRAIVDEGIKPKNSDYSSARSYITDKSSVLPGTDYTFTFTLTAPNTPGNYDIYYDMIREGDCWFRNKNNIEYKKTFIVAVNVNDIDTDGDGFSDVKEEASGTLYWHPDDYP